MSNARENDTVAHLIQLLIRLLDKVLSETQMTQALLMEKFENDLDERLDGFGAEIAQLRAELGQMRKDLTTTAIGIEMLNRRKTE